MTKRRRLLWSGVAVVVLLVVLRFVVRWADATSRLTPPSEIAVAAVSVLVLAALVTGVVLLVRRGQTRKNR